MGKTQTEDFQLGFKLNMRIIADSLEKDYGDIEYYGSDDECCLDGVKFLREKGKIRGNYAYLIAGEDFNEEIANDYEGIPIIIAGKADVTLFGEAGPMIRVGDATDLFDIFDLVQQVFEEYRKWDWRLQSALNGDNPLDDILLASMEVFHNPMFIHDTNFFILSCPRHVKGMQKWETDSRTGRQMVPLSVINDFKVDEEYTNTLSQTEVSMFSAAIRGYRILFMNLWNQGHYEGRILVDEIQTEIKPGDYYVLGYVGRLIEYCMRGRELFWMSMGNDLDSFFTDFLDGKIQEEQKIIKYLQFLRWNRHDRYMCLRIVTDQRDFNMISSTATLGYIEAQIPAGHALLYDNSITVIVNLSHDHSSIAEVLSNLAIILREGLMKTGVSSEITDFFIIPKGYTQAEVALDIGRRGDSTYWCYYFDEYMLRYIIDKASEEIPVQILCADQLHELSKYDQANKTELYRTLMVYLRMERNVLQTSKALYIHRSTLFYRLDRIKQITGLDLEDAQERLKLMISFYMLEGSF